jgi:hypothetical protein
MTFSEDLEKILPQVLRQVQRWVDSMPNPDRPMVASGEGETVSPMDLLQDLKERTSRGKEFLHFWLQMAVKLAMEQPTSGAGSGTGPTASLPGGRDAMEMALPPRPPFGARPSPPEEGHESGK